MTPIYQADSLLFCLYLSKKMHPSVLNSLNDVINLRVDSTKHSWINTEKISEVIKDVFIKENMNTLNFSRGLGEDSCVVEQKWSRAWRIC